MKVSVISREKVYVAEDANLVILCNEYKTVKYKTELSGESFELKNLARFSEEVNAVVISPFDTDNYGILKRSAGVFDKGKLLGISDAAVSYDDSPYMPGVSGGIYETDFGKLGVVVGDDFYSYETLRAYAVCGVKAVVVLKKERPAEMDGIVLRAYAYLLGLPIVFVGGQKITAVDFKGNTVFDGKENASFEIFSPSEYYLKISKTRFSK